MCAILFSLSPSKIGVLFQQHKQHKEEEKNMAKLIEISDIYEQQSRYIKKIFSRVFVEMIEGRFEDQKTLDTLIEFIRNVPEHQRKLNEEEGKNG